MSQTVTVNTAPAVTPVSVAELKAHLRMSGDDGSHDLMLAGMIASATSLFQRLTGTSLVRRTLELHLDRFPVATPQDTGRVIYLPMSPVLRVESVKYLDTDGQQQTLATSAYQADTNHTPGRVALTPDSAGWPDTKRMLGAVTIEYVAGYGDPDEGGAADVPPEIRSAILMLAAHYYDNPKAASELKLEAVPMAVQTIIDNYRVPVL